MDHKFNYSDHPFDDFQATENEFNHIFQIVEFSAKDLKK